MPRAKKGTKWYAVRIGRLPGVYETWETAEKQTQGFPGALHRSFYSKGEAETWASTSGNDMTSSSRNAQTILESRDRRRSGLGISFDPLSQKQVCGQTQDRLPAANGFPHVCPDEEPELSPQQTTVFNRIVNGENLFFTGSAGTGKSVLLRHIIRSFKAKELGTSRMVGEVTNDDLSSPNDAAKPWTFGVTASTGMAAVNISGCTLHSWAGIGLGKLSAQKLYELVMNNNLSRDRWKITNALIIDESDVSMIDGALFDKLDYIGRKIRSDTRPFGGMQIIASGDNFQLPPVQERDGLPMRFCFEAEGWSATFPKDNMLALTRVFRQTEDTFVAILERMRKGMVLPDDVKRLRSCERVVTYEDGIEPVGLYPSKGEVALINEDRLGRLKTPMLEYKACDLGGRNSRGYSISSIEATRILDANSIWPAELRVKMGALVMLVSNMQDGTLVNGSTGKVVDFITIPEAVQKGIYLPARFHAFAPNKTVRWPVVEFAVPSLAVNDTCVKAVIPQMSVDVTNAQGEMEAERHQVPLVLAWALTIHKSQGQTIQRVRVDLQRIFMEGQTYVAISRAVSLDSLEIRNFSADKVRAHARVIAWSRPFEEAQAEDEEWDGLLADHIFDAP